jgi:hypothetical protein
VPRSLLRDRVRGQMVAEVGSTAVKVASVASIRTMNGVVWVSWQQVSVGRHHAGARCDVHVDGELLRF